MSAVASDHFDDALTNLTSELFKAAQRQPPEIARIVDLRQKSF
jgi:hypothetical protein